MGSDVLCNSATPSQSSLSYRTACAMADGSLLWPQDPHYLEDGGGSSLEHKARKDARLETVVRAMELGYVGVAYDRHFRGVISDSLRCSIDPFPLDSLLEVAPSLFSSAAFRRDLLGALRSSTIRQDARLIVSVAEAASVVSLNVNALHRTYDLVAVPPLNQEAFDKACESSMVSASASVFISVFGTTKIWSYNSHSVVSANTFVLNGKLRKPQKLEL